MVTRWGTTPTGDMPSERTFVTEIATGLGMVGDDDLSSVIARRPPEMSNLTAANWDQLTALWASGPYDTEFKACFLNGHTFLASPDALNGRRPRIIEWTGGRRPPGDEVVPSDLRVDHAYLVSCKYLSQILHNSSPARLVEGLLTRAPVGDLRDWYHRVAPIEYQEARRSGSSRRRRDARSRGRGLQMVLRLLALNAEAWTAEHLNAYLADPNEHRAILRHLLHLGATINHGTTAITATLDRPDTPGSPSPLHCSPTSSPLSAPTDPATAGHSTTRSPAHQFQHSYRVYPGRSEALDPCCALRYG